MVLWSWWRSIERRHEDAVGGEVALQHDHLLEDVLADRREGADLEVVDEQVRLGDAQDRGGLADLVLEDVAGELRRHRSCAAVEKAA